MAVVIPTGFAEFTIRGTLPGAQGSWSSVWGIALSDDVAQGNVNDLSEAVAGPWRDWLPATASYNDVRVVVGPDGGGGVFESASGAGTGSSGLDTFCPPQVQGLIKKLTATAGHRGVGRSYMPLIREGEVTDSGNLSDDEIARIAAFASDFLTAVNAIGAPFAELVVLHDSDLTPPSTITSLQTETKVATLRSRYRR